MRGRQGILLLTLLCGNAITAQEAHKCVCADYFTTPTARPAWTSNEGFKHGFYFTHGIAQCTGIQELDLPRADKNARTALSTLLRVQVEHKTHIRRTDGRSGEAVLQARIDTVLESSALLEKSYIYDRWVDPASCSIYSAVRLSRMDLQVSAARQKSGIAYQPLMIVAKGKESEAIESELRQLLSQLKVRRVLPHAQHAAHQSVHRLIAEATHRMRRSPSGTVLYVKLMLNIANAAGESIWTHHSKGKGVSFLPDTPQDILYEKALHSAVQHARQSLKEILYRREERSGSSLR